MLHTSLILLHVSAAAIGLLSGFMAMAFRKGSGLHGAAGSVFFVSMLCMSGAGVYMAAFIKPNGGNLLGGGLAFYLVATGWMAVKRRERSVGVFDWIALLAILAIAAAGANWGLATARSLTGLKDGYNPGLFFMFATIAMLFAASDVRLLVRGGVSGAQRIKRHLWRMSFALFFATFSFFPGQAKLFPAGFRKSSLVYAPHVLVIGAALFWLARLSRRKRTAVAGARSEDVASTSAFGIPRPAIAAPGRPAQVTP